MPAIATAENRYDNPGDMAGDLRRQKVAGRREAANVIRPDAPAWVKSQMADRLPEMPGRVAGGSLAESGAADDYGPAADGARLGGLDSQAGRQSQAGGYGEADEDDDGEDADAGEELNIQKKKDKKEKEKKEEKDEKDDKASFLEKRAFSPARIFLKKLLRLSIFSIIPTYGLSILWTDFHCFMRWIFPNIFCKLGEEWLPDMVQGENSPVQAFSKSAFIFEAIGLAILNLLIMFFILIIVGVVVFIIRSTWVSLYF